MEFQNASFVAKAREFTKEPDTELCGRTGKINNQRDDAFIGEGNWGRQGPSLPVGKKEVG